MENYNNLDKAGKKVIDELLDNACISDIKKLIDRCDLWELLDVNDTDVLLNLNSTYSYSELQDIDRGDFIFEEDIEDECQYRYDLEETEYSLYDLMKKEITDEIFDKYKLEELQEIKETLSNLTNTNLLLNLTKQYTYTELEDIKYGNFIFNNIVEKPSLYDLMKKEITDEIFDKYKLEELQKIQKNINEIL